MPRGFGVLVLLLSAALGCAGEDTTGYYADVNGGAGSASVGVINGVNCDALPLPSIREDVIATFEDGSGTVLKNGGRGGGFYMFNDGTGMQTPPPGTLPPAVPVARCNSRYALCMAGRNFKTWGAGMGTDFAPIAGATGEGPGMKQTYDASAYKGVGFWAKANGSTASVRVGFKDKNTAPEGGRCDASASSGAAACNDDWVTSINLTPDWRPFTILFADLRQSGWGKSFGQFQSESVYSIQFQVGQGTTFDLCVDDLSFMR